MSYLIHFQLQLSTLHRVQYIFVTIHNTQSFSQMITMTKRKSLFTPYMSEPGLYMSLTVLSIILNGNPVEHKSAH